VETRDNSPVRPPLGTYSSRCDEKGRVRLPKEFEDFVRTFPEQEFFVTTLDGAIGRIYPIAVWRENLRLFDEAEQDQQAADDLAYMADYWGSVSGIDAQARVLVPPKLRRELGIENQPVHLRYYRGGIDIYSEAVSERRLAEASSRLAENLAIMRKRGLK
jgi:DNA-binding transcriptional regulator/RsmH inhibitor MraZ